jgi:hypothetical protein
MRSTGGIRKSNRGRHLRGPVPHRFHLDLRSLAERHFSDRGQEIVAELGSLSTPDNERRGEDPEEGPHDDQCNAEGRFIDLEDQTMIESVFDNVQCHRQLK